MYRTNVLPASLAPEVQKAGVQPFYYAGAQADGRTSQEDQLCAVPLRQFQDSVR